jgi:LysM repeat protein
MNFKRLFYYLLLNIIISAATILIVLNIWDRSHNPEEPPAESVSLLPTIIATALPPTNTPPPDPTLAIRPYQVEPGESLSEIAQLFGVSVEQLMEINNLSNPDQIRAGMILDVPISGVTVGDGGDQTPETVDSPPQPAPTGTAPPEPEGGKIKIVSIVGVNDLATEHLQIQSLSPDELSLEGWWLETNDGLVYNFPKITLYEHGAVDLYTRAGINSVVALYWGQSNPIFQSGDRALIFDAEGNLQAVYSIP